MVRVRRGAILADRGARAIGAVEPVVAVGAQAAELAEPERGEIAAMRHDIVGDGCRRDAAGLQAESAQWLDTQLMRSAVLPAMVQYQRLMCGACGIDVKSPFRLRYPSRCLTLGEKAPCRQ